MRKEKNELMKSTREKREKKATKKATGLGFLVVVHILRWPWSHRKSEKEREKSFNQMCMLDFDQIKEGSRIRWWKKYVCWAEVEAFFSREFIGAVAFASDAARSLAQHTVGKVILTCRVNGLLDVKLCYWGSETIDPAATQPLQNAHQLTSSTLNSTILTEHAEFESHVRAHTTNLQAPKRAIIWLRLARELRST